MTFIEPVGGPRELHRAAAVLLEQVGRTIGAGRSRTNGHLLRLRHLLAPPSRAPTRWHPSAAHSPRRSRRGAHVLNARRSGLPNAPENIDPFNRLPSRPALRSPPGGTM